MGILKHELSEYVKGTKELKVFIKKFPRGKSFKAKDINYSSVLKDKLLVVKAVKEGVTNALFEEIKSNSPFSEIQWANFLDVNIRTLQRYKGDTSHIYKPLQSERIFELAEVISKGNSVFDSSEYLNLWLNTPSLALGGDEPISLLDSSYGKDLILAELNRIEYGIFV